MKKRENAPRFPDSDGLSNSIRRAILGAKSRSHSSTRKTANGRRKLEFAITVYDECWETGTKEGATEISPKFSIASEDDLEELQHLGVVNNKGNLTQNVRDPSSFSHRGGEQGKAQLDH